jgi:hypothetical protein
MLERVQWADWLDASNDIAPTFKGSPGETITVEQFLDAPSQPTLDP